MSLITAILKAITAILNAVGGLVASKNISDENGKNRRNDDAIARAGGMLQPNAGIGNGQHPSVDQSPRI